MGLISSVLVSHFSYTKLPQGGSLNTKSKLFFQMLQNFLNLLWRTDLQKQNYFKRVLDHSIIHIIHIHKYKDLREIKQNRSIGTLQFSTADPSDRTGQDSRAQILISYFNQV